MESALSLPAITICFDKNYLLKEEISKNLSKKIRVENKSLFSEEMNVKMNDNMTIEEQFEALESPLKLFDCFVYRNDEELHKTDYEECDSIANFSTFINGNEFCFTIFSQLNEESDDRYLFDYNINGFNDKNFWPLNLIAKQDILNNEITIQLHSRNQLIYNSDKDCKSINIEHLEKLTITYTKTVVNYIS